MQTGFSVFEQTIH